MAKFLIIVALCFFCGVIVTRAMPNKDQLIADFTQNADACAAEENANANDIKEMIEKKPATTKEGKCLRACVMKKYNVLDDSNKLDKTVALKHAETYAGANADKVNVCKEIINACATINVSADRCEAAEQYGHCFMEQAKAHNIENFEM